MMGNNSFFGAADSAPGDHHDIEAFFHTYARTLDAKDVDRVARLHHAPCLTRCGQLCIAPVSVSYSTSLR